MGWLPVFGLAFFTLQEGVQKHFVSSTSSTWDFHHPENLKGPVFSFRGSNDGPCCGSCVAANQGNIFTNMTETKMVFWSSLLRVEVSCSMKVSWWWLTDDIPRFDSGQMKLEYFVKICILVSNSILEEMRTMGRGFSWILHQAQNKTIQNSATFWSHYYCGFSYPPFSRTNDEEKHVHAPYLRFRCRSVVHVFQPFPVMVSWFSRPWYQTHREGLGRVHEALRGSGGLLLMCWGLNSHCFPLVGMVREPYSRGWYTHKDSLVKVGWPLLV